MALKDFLALADDKLEATYHKAEFNVEKARNAVKARLDKAVEQFTATEPTRGQKMWSVNRNVVKLTLPFSVGGKNVVFIPSERFADAVKALQDSIGKGEVDSELEASMTVNETTPRARLPRAPRAAGSGGGKGWTEERRARYAETIAARKAGK